MPTISDNQRRTDDEIDLRQLFYNLRRKWHYFIISIVLFSSGALLYIKLTLPVYEASSSVLIKDSKNASKNIEDLFAGDIFGNTKNVATEIGILRSRSVLEETIHELNLGVSYFGSSPFFNYPLYKSQPFVVKPLHVEEGIYDEKFRLTMYDSSGFKLQMDADNSLIKNYNYTGNHHFGQEIHTPYFNILVNLSDVPIVHRQISG